MLLAKESSSWAQPHASQAQPLLKTSLTRVESGIKLQLGRWNRCQSSALWGHAASGPSWCRSGSQHITGQGRAVGPMAPQRHLGTRHFSSSASDGSWDPSSSMISQWVGCRDTVEKSELLSTVSAQRDHTHYFCSHSLVRSSEMAPARAGT